MRLKASISPWPAQISAAHATKVAKATTMITVGNLAARNILIKIEAPHEMAGA